MRRFFCPSNGALLVEGINAIPADAVEITTETHIALLTAVDQGKQIVADEDGAPVAVDRPGPSAADVRAAKQAEIRDAAEAILAPLKAEYCETEISTWDQQAAQADALIADPDAAAPMVRAIAAERGMDVAELAQHIQANRASWEVISGSVIGQRLAYQDALDATYALTDEDEARTAVAAIEVAYTLPEGA